MNSPRQEKESHRSPKTAVIPGEELKQTTLTLIRYGPSRPLTESPVRSPAECLPFDPGTPVSWLKVCGERETNLLEELGRQLDIHPLILEDIQVTNQRPKLEDHERYLFLEMNLLAWNEENGQIEADQISLLLGDHYLISFQDGERDVFESVRKRLRESRGGRLASSGPDFLAYSLMDVLVDNYFIILENLGEQIEDLESELVTDPDPDTLHAIHGLKRELIDIRKSVWPLREIINSLERGDSRFFESTTLTYLRDVYDHVIQIMDTVETFREMASGMLDIYLSSVSNRMNEIMKVLTIIATLFIPLSFVVGLYGMNFKYMPELAWKWGYPMVWVIIIAVITGMLGYFRHRKWL